MIEVVNALVGGYRRAGDRVRNPGTLKPRKLVERAVAPGRSWTRGDKCRTVDIGKLFGEFPTALLPREIQQPGPDRIRALIVFGGDPVMALGDPERAIPAFEQLDLLVSLDARHNETTAMSDYVIATSQHFERHDLSIPGDSLYPRAFAQYAAPVVDKPPGVIHDWEFFWAVAARMGKSLTLKYWSYGLDYDAIAEGMPLSLEQKPDPEAMLRFLCKDSRVSFDQLLANPGGVRPQLPPEYVHQAPKDNGARLELCPDDVAAELRAVWEETPDTEFKYLLTCRRILEAMNSAYRAARRTRQRYPENWMYMNPDDMAEEGLADGDSAKLSSSVGSIVGKVKAEERLRRGVISMTHMFGAMLPGNDEQQGGYTGRLTSLEAPLEAINFMPRFSGVPVNVGPAHSTAGQGRENQ